MVGFNRRFSPAAQQVKEFLCDRARAADDLLPVQCWGDPRRPLDSGQRDRWRADYRGGLSRHRPGHVSLRFGAGEGLRRIRWQPRLQWSRNDQCFITLRHANGSISNVAYLAGGDKAFPKERIEVFGGARVAIIDDFRRVTTCAGGRIHSRRLRGQDKGHVAEIRAFAEAVGKGGSVPICWEEIRALSR